MPSEALARLPLGGSESAPVRVREVRNAAIFQDPGHDVGERRERVRRLGIGLDAEREHVRIVTIGDGVQLRRRDDEQFPRRRLDRPDPVIRDREDVVAGPLVVAHEHVRRQLAVGVRRMCMQGAAQPDAVALERSHESDPNALVNRG